MILTQQWDDGALAAGPAEFVRRSRFARWSAGGGREIHDR